MRSLTELLTSALITVALLPLFAMTARADLWNNGGPINDTGYCDTQNPCGGSVNGFWVADDFSIAGPSVISSFSYYDFFSPFFFNSSINHYLGTDWVITSGDPFTTPPIASGSSSGTAVVTVNDFFDSTALVTVTGLNVSLAPGTYWLGIQTQLADGDVWTRAAANGNGLPGWEVYDPGSIEILPVSQHFSIYSDTAFTVNPSPTPEPALYGLLGLGLAALFLIQSNGRYLSQVGNKTARGGNATR